MVVYHTGYVTTRSQVQYNLGSQVDSKWVPGKMGWLKWVPGKIKAAGVILTVLPAKCQLFKKKKNEFLPFLPNMLNGVIWALFIIVALWKWCSSCATFAHLQNLVILKELKGVGFELMITRHEGYTSVTPIHYYIVQRETNEHNMNAEMAQRTEINNINEVMKKRWKMVRSYVQNAEMAQSTGINISEVRKRRCKWLGCVFRMQNERHHYATLKWDPSGQRRVWKLRETWWRIKEWEIAEVDKNEWIKVACPGHNLNGRSLFVSMLHRGGGGPQSLKGLLMITKQNTTYEYRVQWKGKEPTVAC